MDHNSILHLTKLFREISNDHTQMNELDDYSCEKSAITPSTIASDMAEKAARQSNGEINTSSTQTQCNQIWKEEELDMLPAKELELRPQPEYEMIYKQKVKPEDIYLAMGNPTSYESVIIRVLLPGTVSSAEINVEIQTDRLYLMTSKYFLLLTLPYKAVENESCAKWDIDSQTLELTIKLDKEFNF